MSDQSNRQPGAGCGVWLAWFLAAGAVRYIVRDVLHLGPGWQLAAVLTLLVIWLIVLAGRQANSTKQQGDAVSRCNWCPNGEPLLKHHPGGQAEHIPDRQGDS